MNNGIVLINFKDTSYYNDNFNYKKYYILKEYDFEEKYSKLIETCKNYEDFVEIEEFLKNNFKILDNVEENEILL